MNAFYSTHNTSHKHTYQTLYIRHNTTGKCTADLPWLSELGAHLMGCSVCMCIYIYIHTHTHIISWYSPLEGIEVEVDQSLTVQEISILPVVWLQAKELLVCWHCCNNANFLQLHQFISTLFSLRVHFNFNHISWKYTPLEIICREQISSL
jgi:hypothetical protein